jgi:transcriptional regulator with XRE-family HTH domain
MSKAVRKTRELHLPSAVRIQRRAIRKRIAKVMGDRSQRGWSRELGVPQQNISRYLSGGCSPHVDFLIHLARREGINLNWLVLGEGRKYR